MRPLDGEGRAVAFATVRAPPNRAGSDRRQGNRPPGPRAHDRVRGEPIAPLAGARTAEAIVPAIEPGIAIPNVARPEAQTSRHRDLAEALVRVATTRRDALVSRSAAGCLHHASSAWRAPARSPAGRARGQRSAGAGAEDSSDRLGPPFVTPAISGAPGELLPWFRRKLARR